MSVTTPPPAAVRGFPLGRLTITELKLLPRQSAAFVLRLAVPLILLVIFGAIPFYTKPRASLDGYTLLDAYVPILVAYSVGFLTLFSASMTLAGYRERGVLRRLRTTPAGPVRVLAAQLIANSVVIALLTILILAVARVAYGVSLPRLPAGFIVAVALATAAMLAIGLLVAAVAPGAQAAQGIGMALLLPMMFFAGLFFPIPVMPTVLRHISRATPLGAAVQSLQDAWLGHWPPPLQLWTLAAYAVACGLAAAKLFRWE
jgi:ABC-2 type transport system permease protein